MLFQEWIANPDKATTIYSDTQGEKTLVTAQVFVTEGTIRAKYGDGGNDATEDIQAGGNALVQGDTLAAECRGGTRARGIAALLGVPEPKHPELVQFQEWI